MSSHRRQRSDGEFESSPGPKHRVTSYKCSIVPAEGQLAADPGCVLLANMLRNNRDAKIKMIFIQIQEV